MVFRVRIYCGSLLRLNIVTNELTRTCKILFNAAYYIHFIFDAFAPYMTTFYSDYVTFHNNEKLTSIKVPKTCQRVIRFI